MALQNRDYGIPALFIDGEWVSHTARMGDVRNPATGEFLANFPFAEPAHIDRALSSSLAGFEVWRKMPHEARCDLMHRAARLLREKAEVAARHMTLELGRPIAESRLEMENCANLLDWCATAAGEHHDRALADRAGFVAQTVRKEPVGPVAAFATWNFPASLATRKMASALAVGCSVIVKPAEETPCSFKSVVEALDAAGLPRGVVNLLLGDPVEISRRLITSPVIRKIAFTGSTPVGKQLAALAGSEAKPCVMELGGHAAVVVFEDADIDRAIALSVATKSRNAGQVCISPTRYLVQEGVHKRFATGFATAFSALRLGDGFDPETQMGPLISQRRLESVDALVQDAIAQGAHLLTGGTRLNRPGNFYAPTVLVDVPDEARIMHEEPFGPVAIINRFSDLDDAVAKANSTDFALAAYAFTGSQETAKQVSDALDAGMVGINGYGVVFLDSPLGGRRQSGFGSEGGYEGLDAYRIVKFVSQAIA